MRVMATLSAVIAIAGCASAPGVPTGMKAGQFVDYACEGGKRLSARAASDGSTVRVRFEGGYELDRKPDGSYEADGFKLTSNRGALDLAHHGKVVATGCKAA